MASSKHKRKQKLSPIIIAIIVVIPIWMIGNAIISDIRHGSLYSKVHGTVEKELNSIIVGKRSPIYDQYDYGCQGDYKTRTTRCGMSYGFNFASNLSDAETMKKISVQLQKLGWQVFDSDKDSVANGWSSKDYGVSFSKRDKYPLNLQVSVVDKENSLITDYKANYIDNLINDRGVVYSIFIQADDTE